MSHAIQRRLEALQHPTPGNVDFNGKIVIGIIFYVNYMFK